MGLFSFRNKNFIWTESNYSGIALDQIPYIRLTEYQQEQGQVWTGIERWIKYANEKGANAGYSSLYAANATGNVYEIPYLNSYNRNIGNNWVDQTGAISQQLKSFQEDIKNVAQLFSANAGILTPKSWNGTGPESYTVILKLLNTVEQDGWMSNDTFLRTLTRQTLSGRTSYITSMPPCIYTVEIPGIRWCPAAVIKSLNVVNEGTMNLSSTGETVPDAWLVNILIEELVPQTREIFDGIFGKRVTVINTDATVPGFTGGPGGTR